MTDSFLFSRNDDGRYEIIGVDQALVAALRFLQARIARHGNVASPQDARALCALKLGALDHEVFAVLFLDAQNRIIEFRELFRGTLTQTSVYPREVVKEALQRNAAAVILTHNHPSGVGDPSRADEHITQTLKASLGLVDVRVLDHIIVAGGTTVSFAERGLL